MLDLESALTRDEIVAASRWRERQWVTSRFVSASEEVDVEPGRTRRVRSWSGNLDRERTNR